MKLRIEVHYYATLIFKGVANYHIPQTLLNKISDFSYRILPNVSCLALFAALHCQLKIACNISNDKYSELIFMTLFTSFILLLLFSNVAHVYHFCVQLSM